MNFDTIIIGGGMAGLTCALRCLESGLKTAVIASGQSALHFSSGSIDVLSHTPQGKQVTQPFAELENFKNQYPNHPYGKLNTSCIVNALNWYQETLRNAGISLTSHQNHHNHMRLTPLGTFKPTWLSQEFVHQFPLSLNEHSFKKLVLVSIDGFRDFQPELAADNLKQLDAFKHTDIKTANVELNAFKQLTRNHCELRSIDLARIIKDENQLSELAMSLLKHANKDDLVVIPAIFGTDNGLELLSKLQSMTGLRLCEVPTMPPSLLGIRLEEAMLRQFTRQGGTLIRGTQVIKGEFDSTENSNSTKNKALTLKKIYTNSMADMPLSAKQFVLASGSFFSQGLKSDTHSISEPVFNLDLHHPSVRSEWHSPQFFDQNPHPFLAMGVETDEQFRPRINNRLVENLYCAGAVLAHYNPIFEGNGSGVAISTGYFAAQQIITNAQHQTHCTNNNNAEVLL